MGDVTDEVEPSNSGSDSVRAADDDLAEPVETEADIEAEDSGLHDRQMIAAARRRHGTLGGVIAAGMLGIDKVLGRKPREEIPVVVDAPTEPVDIDTDGITVPLDEHTDVISPPIPRTVPKVAPARRSRW